MLTNVPHVVEEASATVVAGGAATVHRSHMSLFDASPQGLCPDGFGVSRTRPDIASGAAGYARAHRAGRLYLRQMRGIPLANRMSEAVRWATR